MARKAILTRPLPQTLNSETKEKQNAVLREQPSSHTLEVKKCQKTVLRQFRRLSPVCDAIREKFHVRKKVETVEDFFKSTEDTNILFGMGHSYSNNARLNHRKVTTRYHLIDMNRSNQFWKLEPSPSIEENWNLFFGTEPPPDPLRPATHASSRSSAKGPSSRPLSRRSSVASRIQSTTNRMKNKHMKSKVAGSIARHLRDASVELENGPEHHLEYFLHSLNLQATDNQGDDSPQGDSGEPTAALIEKRNERQLENPVSLAQLPAAITMTSDNYSAVGFNQKLFRRPINPIIKSSRLPKFDFAKFNPCPFGSVHSGENSYKDSFPSLVREMRLVPDYMKETPLLAIMKLPSAHNSGSVLHNVRSQDLFSRNY